MDRTGRRIIDRGDPAAICRTHGDASYHHAGDANIDAELRCPIDFLRGVEPAHRFAEQAKVLGLFEIDLGGNWLLCGGLGQFAIGGGTAAVGGRLAGIPKASEVIAHRVWSAFVHLA